MSRFSTLFMAVFLVVLVGGAPSLGWAGENKAIPLGIDRDLWRAYDKDTKGKIVWLHHQKEDFNQGIRQIESLRKAFIEAGYPKATQEAMLTKLWDIIQIRNNIVSKLAGISSKNVASGWYLLTLEYITAMSCASCIAIAKPIADSGDKVTAKQIYRDAVINYHDPASKPCVKTAEFALEDLKENAN